MADGVGAMANNSSMTNAISILHVALGSRPKQRIKDHSLVEAAVLLLLFYHRNEHWILLNRRTELVEHHRGEISCPGGKRDAMDENLLQTALRETHEELGVLPADVTILGELDDLQTSSRFRISPFVGILPYPYEFHISELEVAEMLEMPLAALADPANHRAEVRLVDGRLLDAPNYVYNGNLVYGATARILEQFMGLVEALPEKELLWKELHHP